MVTTQRHLLNKVTVSTFTNIEMTPTLYDPTQSQITYLTEMLGVSIQNSTLNPSQQRLDNLFQIATDLLDQSERIAPSSQTLLAVHLTACADDLDKDHLALLALPSRLKAIAVALPAQAPLLEVGEALKQMESFPLSSNPAAWLTAIAQQLLADPPSLQALKATGLFTA